MRLIIAVSLQIALIASACNRSRMQRLVDVSHGVRFTEARLGDFSYAAGRPVQRSAADDEDAITLRMASVAADVLANTTSTDAETRRARAIADLMRHHPSDAVHELEPLVISNNHDARIWSDLAAARYELARTTDNAQEYASALAAAAEALRVDPLFPPARFNHALSLEALQLRTPAAQSFGAYLAIDHGSEWAVEARDRLRQCERRTEHDDWTRAEARLRLAGIGTSVDEAERIVGAFPQQARAWAEGEYLANWGVAMSRGDATQAQRWLTATRTIAAVLRRTSGETLLFDAVAAIDRADAATTAVLARAHETYRQGRIRYRDRDIDQAARLFAAAELQFADAHSPFVLHTRFYRANAIADHGDADAGLRLLEEVASETPPAYHALLGYIEWERGTVLGRIGRPYEALDHAQRAQTAFHALGEMDNDIRMQIHVSTLLSFLGRAPDAWAMRRTIFQSVSDSGNDVLLEQALNACARNELQEHHLDIARAILDIELAQPTTSSRLRVDALLARVSAAAGASSDFELLRQAAARIPPNALRDEALDDIRLAEATAVRERDPQRSVQLASAAIDFRLQHHLPLTLPAACVERARAYRSLDDLNAASADLTRAVVAIEQQRSTISRSDFRDTSESLAADAWRELIDVHIRRGRFEEAFMAAEQQRIRSGAWSVLGGNSHLSSSAAIASKLRRGTLIAEYVAASDRLLIVTLSAAGVQMHQTTLPAGGRSPERLFDALIAPLSRELAAADTLVIIPDDSLASISFASLRDARTGRYVVEDVAVVIAASSNAYIDAVAQSRSSVAHRVLLVGDPDVDTKRFPAMPRLPAARDEATALASDYPGAVRLLGAEATRRRVLECIASSDVIDLAAHAIINDRDPWLSVIALAPGGDDSGLLYLHDIASIHTTASPVVVLSGCRTAVASGGHGSIRSLAMAFLAAGSRSVVGTLWNVDDSIAAEFSRSLHVRLRRGVPVGTAVRDVQLSMLHGANPGLRAPEAWSAFQLYGSDH